MGMKQFIQSLWLDPEERPLFLSAVAVLGVWVIWVLLAYKFPVWICITNSLVITILSHEGFGKIVEGLCSGLVAAYLFYLVVDMYPRRCLKQQHLDALNLLIVSVLDVFKSPGMFRHEAEIQTADTLLLNKFWLIEQISRLIDCHAVQEQRPFFLQIKWVAERAERRLNDFRHALTLAVVMSPQHAIQWLSLTDKLTLLVETMHAKPEFGANDVIPWQRGVDPINSNYAVYMRSLCFRLQEFFEKTVEWIHLNDPSSVSQATR